MSHVKESKQNFSIELPELGDEVALASMHVQSWKETYVAQHPELTAGKVDEMLLHITSDTSYRRNTIDKALANPDKILYRVVKNREGHIVGFLHGTKHDSHNLLDGIYLLDEAKGSGVGGQLMELFLNWIDSKKITKLEVFSFNKSAIGFYQKFGFSVTDEDGYLYQDMLEAVQMERPVQDNL